MIISRKQNLNSFIARSFLWVVGHCWAEWISNHWLLWAEIPPFWCMLPPSLLPSLPPFLPSFLSSFLLLIFANDPPRYTFAHMRISIILSERLLANLNSVACHSPIKPSEITLGQWFSTFLLFPDFVAPSKIYSHSMAPLTKSIFKNLICIRWAVIHCCWIM